MTPEARSGMGSRERSARPAFSTIKVGILKIYYKPEPGYD